MVAHSGEEVGGWVSFDSHPCTDCSQRLAVPESETMTSKHKEERPVKVTYTETPITSPTEPFMSFHVPRLSHSERRRRRLEKSHGIIQGLLALAFCILSTMFICTVAAFFGLRKTSKSTGLSDREETLSRSPQSSKTKDVKKKEQMALLRATRLVGN